MHKLIPPVLVAIIVLLMICLHFVSPTVVISSPLKYGGSLFIILGLLMAKKVSIRFNEADTEIHTFKRPRRLVTDGLFRYTRNPIYLAFVIALVGVNIVLGSVLPISGVILFILIANMWYIPYEEKVMEQQFGEAYKRYKNKVRRWL